MAELNHTLGEIKEGCTECGSCVNQCAYLQWFGTPAAQAIRFAADDLEPEVIYSCSLCGLCDVFCPEQLHPAEMFRQMRSRLVEQGRGPLKHHRRILAYEKRGLSPLFCVEMLPKNCKTVFFPGCALAGTSNQTAYRLFTLLNERIDDLGIVLDCCTKPSHDLGRIDFFNDRFSKLTNRFRARGVTSILTACPSCHQVFSRYAAGFDVTSVYEIFADTIDSRKITVTPEAPPAIMTIHDPCATRFDPAVQQSVRRLAARLGCEIKEMKHSRRKTFCCGEGGSASFVAPEISGQWSLKRKTESRSTPILTYCTGCVQFLSKEMSITHIFELLLGDTQAGNKKNAVAKAPFTYLNRLLLKYRLRRGGVK